MKIWGCLPTLVVKVINKCQIWRSVLDVSSISHRPNVLLGDVPGNNSFPAGRCTTPNPQNVDCVSLTSVMNISFFLLITICLQPIDPHERCTFAQHWLSHQHQTSRMIIQRPFSGCKMSSCICRKSIISFYMYVDISRSYVIFRIHLSFLCGTCQNLTSNQ